MKKTFFPKLILVLLTVLAMVPSSAEAKKKKFDKPSSRAVYHNNQGVTAMYEGNFDRAVFELKTAVELEPKYLEGWNNLGLAYKYKGRYEDAIKALQKAI